LASNNDDDNDAVWQRLGQDHATALAATSARFVASAYENYVRALLARVQELEGIMQRAGLVHTASAGTASRDAYCTIGAATPGADANKGVASSRPVTMTQTKV